nr:hypothetical protein [Fusobacterium gastrosuis]
MTSGNFLNLEISKDIGDFEEKFFIDEVDHEYCYKIYKKGYKVLIINNIMLEHNLGNSKKHGLYWATHHNYIRRYYIVRNRCYMIKKYKPKGYITYLLKTTLKIILSENDKKRKLKMTYLGVRDFFHGVSGKINDKYL